MLASMTLTQFKEWMAVYLIEAQDLKRSELSRSVNAKVRQPMKGLPSGR